VVWGYLIWNSRIRLPLLTTVGELCGMRFACDFLAQIVIGKEIFFLK